MPGQRLVKRRLVKSSRHGRAAKKKIGCRVDSLAFPKKLAGQGVCGQPLNGYIRKRKRSRRYCSLDEEIVELHRCSRIRLSKIDVNEF
jgi:hypothetical protein